MNSRGVCNSDSSSNIYPEKENKKVYFDSKNPENCMTEYSKSGNNMLLLFMIVPIIFIVFSILGIIKVNKRVKAVLELNQNGKLVKTLQYRMENTGTIVNGVPIQRPVVDYVLPNGISVTLYGDAINDKKSFDSDGRYNN